MSEANPKNSVSRTVVTVMGTLLGVVTIFLLIWTMVSVSQPPQVVQPDLHALQQSEQEALRTYKRIDKNKGIVRIPIEAAMDKLIQEGIPSTQPATTRQGT
jgi:hypothetical protein